MTDFRFDPEKHRYFIDGRRVVGITEAMVLAGLKPPLDPKTRTHSANIRYAGERGTAVHRMIELDNLGTLDQFDVDESLMGYVRAWRAFREEYGFCPDPDVTEKPLGHPVLMFGGTPDHAGRSLKLGRYLVVEVKQRDLQDYDEFQVAGQEILVKDVLGKPVSGFGMLVRLNADGTYIPRHCKMREARSLFISAAQIGNWKISNG